MATRRTSSRRRRALADFQGTPRTSKSPAGASAAGPSGGTTAGRSGAGRAGTGRSGAGRAARQARPDADGKVLVACPECAQQYRVPEERMGSKIKCGNCQRSFFPKAMSARSQRTPAGGTNARPFVIGGAVLVLVVGLGYVISSVKSSGVKMAEPAKVVKHVNISWTNPRVQAVATWANAIQDKNDLRLSQHSDRAALRSFLGMPASAASTAEELGADRKALWAELRKNDKSEVFRDFEASDGTLEDEAQAEAAEGNVQLVLSPRPGTVYIKAASAHGMSYFGKALDARVTVHFRADGDDILVTGWEVTHMPRKPRPPGKVHKPHETIAKPVEVERVIDGEKRKVFESELSPLGHLKDTPPDVRQEIDKLIADLGDLSAPGYVSNRCIDKLKKIGRPAIPRLLNRMYELKPNTNDDKLVLRRVIQALTVMSGVRFGYNVANKTDLTVDGNEAQRESALKQWYAWWYKTYDRDFTTAIDKEEDESLFLTEKEKAALKKAQEASAEKKK